jgi:hypothetical protein
VLYAQEEIRDCEMEFELGIKKWQHDKTLDEVANPTSRIGCARMRF